MAKAESTIIKAHKEQFNTVADLLETVVRPLNQDFGSDSIVVKIPTGQYMTIVCKFKDCLYSHWYNYKVKDGEFYDI